MRELTSGLEASVSAKFTDPVFLVSQDMGASVLYDSSREQITWLGQNYLATLGLRVENINRDSLDWSLDNSDRSVSVLGLTNDVGGNAVTAWLYYGGQAVTRFTGVIDSWQTSGQRVVFQATSQASKEQKFPNERFENGTFNHLPAPGTNIQWGLQTVILESEPN